jgi:hypothetical protein
MDARVKQFVETILSFNPASIDMFGGGIPGMLGNSAAVQGAVSPAADVALSLKRQAAAFYHAYQSNTNLSQTAAKLEEALLTAEAVSLLNTEQAGKLLDELHKLMEAKK